MPLGERGLLYNAVDELAQAEADLRDAECGLYYAAADAVAVSSWRSVAATLGWAPSTLQRRMAAWRRDFGPPPIETAG